MPLLNLLTQCPILQNPLAKGATQKINMHHYHNSDAYYILHWALIYESFSDVGES